jgi:hypothetical protein
VPTLFRFLAAVALVAGVAYAGLYALANLVVPQPREMRVTIPAAKLQPSSSLR